MAMTPQQARMKAMQLRSLKPELRNMAIEDLTAQVMATEGMGAPGAGGGGLADLFPPKTLTPSSPAPMAAARFQAAKPTADIVPGAGTDAFRRAQEVRQRTERGPTPDERAAANANRQALMAELPASMAASTSAPAAEPVREATPAPEAAPKATYRSRFRTELEQKEAALEQLKASIQPGVETPAELASELRNLSGVVNRLKGLVAAEEGAVVDADRAALLERQTARLAREEELADKAKKRAPFDALIAAGTALGSARPGESFTSAFTRGLAAGNESYSGARDAREASRRSIEEKRDAYTLQKIEAIDSARSKAIEMANAGVKLRQEEYALANLSDADVVALGTQKARIDEAVAKADKAKTEALFAPKILQSGLDVDQAQISNYRETSGSGGSGGSGGTGGKPLSPTQAYNRAESSRKQLDKLEKRIIEADGKGDVAGTEQLLNQYKAYRDAYNQNAAGAGLPPITVRGFPVKLPKYESYVKKNKKHPSGRTYATGSTGSTGSTGTIVSSKPLK